MQNNGYKAVNIQLGSRGKYKTCTVHRLIALAYIPNPMNKATVNHIDGDKTNIDMRNLEWATYSENNMHALKTGLKKRTRLESEKCHFAQYSKDDAIYVCDLLERGYSPRYISKTYPQFKYDFVNHIYKRHTWRELSKERDFSKVVKYSKTFTPEEVIEMERLFESGLSVNDVIGILDIEPTQKNRANAKTIKRRIKNKSS
jgi:hypothetical protein